PWPKHWACRWSRCCRPGARPERPDRPGNASRGRAGSAGTAECPETRWSAPGGTSPPRPGGLPSSGRSCSRRRCWPVIWALRWSAAGAQHDVEDDPAEADGQPGDEEERDRLHDGPPHRVSPGRAAAPAARPLARGMIAYRERCVWPRPWEGAVMSADRPLLVRVDPRRLIRAMERAGVSWLRLALEAGLDRPTRRRLLAGEPVPLRAVSAIAGMLDIGPDDLLAETEAPSP